MDASIKPTVRQVNENQCQQCMPLGGVIAFKGLEDSMVIVHGSQGCSTYMRLINVEHYNEPIDIASSSLNEKQTIHGGEANLKKAIDNVIRVYQPKVLGIVTTCLTETMGEDPERIIAAYHAEHGTRGIEIIPVPTPSYQGSQTEGFFAATKAIISHYAKPVAKHRRINVIIPHISPADIREIKRLMGLMGCEYTLIPDYSLTLDGPAGKRYRKIPRGGTKTDEIARMAGAPLTIQFGETCPEEISPGLWLQEKFGVPLTNLPLPVGIDATDRFLMALQAYTRRKLPESLVLERGWLLDGMADAHKHTGEIRATIYGEPELVNAIVRVSVENGVTPVVIATGTKTSLLARCVNPCIADLDEQPILLEGADFAGIEDAACKSGTTIAIGHSGGKFFTEKHGIPVVRIGFPIHDRIGGQRILSVGYLGTLAFLDRLTNCMLETRYATYRSRIRNQMKISEGV
jgi:nitrogenase molybdenum-iron protein NifN